MLLHQALHGTLQLLRSADRLAASRAGLGLQHGVSLPQQGGSFRGRCRRTLQLGRGLLRQGQGNGWVGAEYRRR